MFGRDKTKYLSKEQLEEFIRSMATTTHELISAAGKLDESVEKAGRVLADLKNTVDRAEKVGARLRSSGPKSGW